MELTSLDQRYVVKELNALSGKSIDTLIRNFSAFAQHKQLSVTFVHPGTNEKWILHPHTHALVSDPESLATGLKAMAESVPSV